jgi:hypothetical protein
LPKSQQSFDQPGHALAGVVNASQIMQRLFVELLAGGFLQDLTEAGQAAQRRAQVVRDRVSERLQLAIRCLQLSRAFGDALLQLGVHLLHFAL